MALEWAPDHRARPTRMRSGRTESRTISFLVFGYLSSGRNRDCPASAGAALLQPIAAYGALRLPRGRNGRSVQTSAARILGTSLYGDHPPLSFRSGSELRLDHKDTGR